MVLVLLDFLFKHDLSSCIFMTQNGTLVNALDHLILGTKGLLDCVVLGGLCMAIDDMEIHLVFTSSGRVLPVLFTKRLSVTNCAHVHSFFANVMVVLITLIIDQVLQFGVVIVPVSVLVVVAIHNLPIFTLYSTDSFLLLCLSFGEPPHVHVFLHVRHVLLAQIFIDLVQLDI